MYFCNKEVFLDIHNMKKFNSFEKFDVTYELQTEKIY